MSTRARPRRTVSRKDRRLGAGPHDAPAAPVRRGSARAAPAVSRERPRSRTDGGREGTRIRAEGRAERVLVEVRDEGVSRAGPLLSRLRRSATRFLDVLDLDRVELSVLLTTDDGIRVLNREWRRKDRPTDVLSFPAGEPPPGATGLRHLGDVILSLDTARRQARAHRRALGDELDLYLAHGLLHLLGHDHHRRRDAERMAALEARLLGRTGMVPPR